MAGGGGGMLSSVGDLILQDFYTICDLILNLQNCCPSQAKTLEGRGPQTVKKLPQSPFAFTFKVKKMYVTVQQLPAWKTMSCDSNSSIPASTDTVKTEGRQMKQC